MPGTVPPVVRAYRRTNAEVERVERALDALITGFYLGAMSRADLAALDAVHYESAVAPTGSRSLPYAHPDQVRSGLFDWEREALEAAMEPGGRLIVTAAGAGREVLGALALGLDATGWEPLRELCEAGAGLLEADGHPGRLQLCERDGFPDAPPADGVLVGWGSLSHIPGRARRNAFLRGARARLSVGDPLIVSFWASPGLARYLRIVHAAARVVRAVRRDEPPEYGDLLSPMYVRIFTLEEVGRECAAAGFEPVSATLDPYPHVVARAV